MRKAGFTLIEILIVVAIIALLAAFMFPVFAMARAKGRSAACTSNLRQLGMAFQQYIGDYGAYPRGLDASDKYTPQIWSATDFATIVQETPMLDDVLNPYVKSTQVWQCSSDTGFDICDTTNLPLNARPTCYEAFRMSYFYRTELTFRNLSDDLLQRPAEVNVMADASGNWHGKQNSVDWNDKRYNILFADGHVKSQDGNGFNTAWKVKVTHE